MLAQVGESTERYYDALPPTDKDTEMNAARRLFDDVDEDGYGALHWHSTDTLSTGTQRARNCHATATQLTPN